MSDETQFCSFTVGDLYLGIPVHDVQEVIRSLDMTSVPLAPDSVRGLINLRGQIVTAIDLRRRLGLVPRETEADAMHVVVRTDGGPVSFMVDEIDDVIETGSGTWERAPESLSRESHGLIIGVHKLPDTLLLVLDTARAAATDAVAA